jgi:hypothetical protein
MVQTPRSVINLGECLFDYYTFNQPAFEAVRNWFSNQKIKETKGVFSDIPEDKLGEVAKYAEMIKKRKKFKTKPTEEELRQFKKEYPMGWVEEEELKATEYLLDDQGNPVTAQPLLEDGSPDLTKKPKKIRVPKKSYWACWNEACTLNVVVNGFRFDFGVGGIHGSIAAGVYESCDQYLIVDIDVSSFYPNLAIRNRFYPLHLGIKFCDIYEDVYNKRSIAKKKAKIDPKDISAIAVNEGLKLALNGSINMSHFIR